jgi:hypothetical protein
MDKTTQTKPSADLKSVLAQIEAACDLYLVKKAPFTIPENVKELIVKYGPYLSLVVIVLSLPAILALFGVSALFTPFAYLGGVSFGIVHILSTIVLLATMVLEALALPGLFKRSKTGWTYLYYSVLVNAVYQLINMNLGGLIIGTLLSLYLLFQIKSYYR